MEGLPAVERVRRGSCWHLVSVHMGKVEALTARHVIGIPTLVRNSCDPG